MSTITGYRQDVEGAYIGKDRLAQLTYTMDWQYWLAQGQTVTSVAYTLTNPTYNPTPMTIVTSGIADAGTKTFVKLAAGTVGKIYGVTAQITTDDASVDRRTFRVQVENTQL